MTPQGAVGSNPTLSAIQFYTYSIKSSITSHLTGRLAIAILSWATSSTAFLSYNPINNLSRIIAAAVHKGTGSQSNNPTYDFKISDINLFVKKRSKREFSIFDHIYSLCDDK